MDSSKLFKAGTSFLFLYDDELHTQLPLINELFCIIDNSPTINKVGFEILYSERSRNVSLLVVTFGLLCRAWARITRSRSFQEPIHVVEFIDGKQ